MKETKRIGSSYVDRKDTEPKYEKVNLIGTCEFGYMKDSATHSRGRDSTKSNQRTYGSQVRYLPGSIRDESETFVPKSSIKLHKDHKNRQQGMLNIS